MSQYCFRLSGRCQQKPSWEAYKFLESASKHMTSLPLEFGLWGQTPGLFDSVAVLTFTERYGKLLACSGLCVVAFFVAADLWLRKAQSETGIWCLLSLGCLTPIFLPSPCTCLVVPCKD